MNDLIAALSMRIARKYRKVWNPDRYKELFSQFTESKNAYRIYLPLDSTAKPDIHVSPYITRTLDRLGYTIEDYVEGICKKAGDEKRIYKIGRVLTKALEDYGKQGNIRELEDVEQTYKNFTQDPQRKVQKSLSEYIAVISRHPYDIAGMSTGRGWTSCMNVQDGSYKKYVLQDVKKGSLVAYCIKKDDLNIESPAGRILIKPFVNKKDKNDFLLVSEGTIYGTPITGFKGAVNNWIDKVNGPDKAGVFCIVKGLHDDDMDTTIKKHRSDYSDVTDPEIALEILQNRLGYENDDPKDLPESVKQYLISIALKSFKTAPALSLLVPGLELQVDKVLLKAGPKAVKYIVQYCEQHKDRWTEGEKVILKVEPSTSMFTYVVRYLENVVKGPWPEAEAAFTKAVVQYEDLDSALAYFKVARKGQRWPEFERVLLNDVTEHFYMCIAYTRAAKMQKILGPNKVTGWPEFEQTVLKEYTPRMLAKISTLCTNYMDIKLARWPELEDFLIRMYKDLEGSADYGFKLYSERLRPILPKDEWQEMFFKYHRGKLAEETSMPGEIEASDYVNKSDKVKIIYYSNRSTPQVVKPGKTGKAKAGYGKRTKVRSATPEEVAQFKKGKWLRTREDGKKPGDSGSKQSKYRPQLAKKSRDAKKKRLAASDNSYAAFIRENFPDKV